MANRPTGREKHISGGGTGVNRRGTGASGGPAGSGYGPRPGGSSGGSYGGGSNRGSGGSRALGGGLGAGGIIIVIILMLALSQCSHGSGLSGLMTEEDHTSYLSGTTTSNWDGGLDNNGTLNAAVADSAREKRTQILGNGQDVNTIMVYMCGTDLESRSGMATRDLQEMLNATVGSNINLIIYTGGCTKWQNNVVSSKQNQIYQIQNGKLRLLKDNAGTGAMTDPATLSAFLKWGAAQFPANRYDLIFWDHGGGSNSGYGYDEKYPNKGSMTLAGIDTALKDSGVTFDFIGFDACLMATVETGMVTAKYADYMIASEETEPGVGWYYTDWLTKLSANPGMSTLELGKLIIDSYTNACAQSTPGQSTTLSLTDLAELEATAPAALTSFAKSTSNMINNNGYQTVASARAGTREFAASTKIDQVDFVHLARNLGTDPAEGLAKTLLSAVKYNRTSSSMTNAYGLSVYFPYKQVRKVDSMVSTYKAIGMDEDYTRCIQEFASMEVSGQVVSQNSGGGATSLLEQLSGLGSYSGSTSGSANSLMSQSDIAGLLSSFMGGSGGVSLDGLSGSDFGFLGRTLDVEDAASYIAKNQLDQSTLNWTDKSGYEVISLPEEQWELVQNLDLNMFYDDGSAYVDLGLDNVFSFDSDGDLVLPDDRTWVAINGQTVAYYRIGMTGSDDDYTITGRVPAELNGVRVNLILVFDSANPKGYVAGAAYDYVDGETETVAKNLTEISAGDKLDFVCDLYDYNGNYAGTDYLGETMTVSGSMDDFVISNTSVGDGGVIISYRFQDIYGQEYWTPAVALQ